ncbi:hypothetical protein MUB24_17040 [Lederbergia sp. NSJ-179]|uniref:hypothetical protein n=1 Tax=Lederbergia sp. NSJ-179 TaxID=2931402 RepID=UPI001FD2BB4D|nr:hypothetical protein [Lederbergia sp. NSJ-179]MCJ7842571.1 hypothetical protein [Lederbergia sp. NSJ-179]
MIKLKIYLLSTLIIFIFSSVACTNNEDTEGTDELIFKGESENWRVVLEVEQLETPGSSLVYTFSYIGEGIKPKVFYYEIDPNSPASSVDEGSLENQDEMSLFAHGDTEPIYKNMPIHITINWDNKSEDVLIKVK